MSSVSLVCMRQRLRCIIWYLRQFCHPYRRPAWLSSLTIKSTFRSISHYIHTRGTVGPCRWCGLESGSDEEAKYYGIQFSESTTVAELSLNEYGHLSHRATSVQRLWRLLSGCMYSALDTHVMILQICSCTWRGVGRPLCCNRPSLGSGPTRDLSSLPQTDVL
jgi:hypothetical protein